MAARPVDAASLVVIDTSGRTPKLLMGRRRADLRFMPGYVVFPGGRLEPEDRKVPAFGMMGERCHLRLQQHTVRPSAQRARALALAAIRETFEETGYRLAISDPALPPCSAGTSWNAFMNATHYPDLGSLRYVARAITPPHLTIRFDTRFFCALHDPSIHGHQALQHDSGELEDTGWLSFRQARDANLHRVTRLVLDEVEQRLEKNFSDFRPVPLWRMTRESLVRTELI